MHIQVPSKKKKATSFCILTTSTFNWFSPNPTLPKLLRWPQYNWNTEVIKRDMQLLHITRTATLLSSGRRTAISFPATTRGSSFEVLTYYLVFHCSFQQLSLFFLTASDASSGSFQAATSPGGFCLLLVIVQFGESVFYNCQFYHEFKKL